MLNYEAETYLKDGEIAWLQSTFKDNPVGINILRKCFLPTVIDLPIEELVNDIWFKGIDFIQMPNEEVKSQIVGRQDAIKFIMGGLINIKQIANMKVESKEELAERARKESNK